MTTLVATVSRRLAVRWLASRLDRPRVVGAVALVVGVLFAAAVLASSEGDVSKLVHAAPPWSESAAAPDSLTVQPDDQGYDGQFYYRVAVAPMSKDPQVAGVTFDLPSLRRHRITYPLLASVASLGQDDLVPWALLLVNLAAFGALGWVGALLARNEGRHPAWGLLAVAYPGLLFSLSLDLAEVVTSLLVLGGLLTLRQRPEGPDRALVAAALLTLGVLTRETAAVVPLAILLAWCWGRLRNPEGQRPPPSLLLPAVVPLVVDAAWQTWLRWDTGQFPLTSSGDNNLRLPLQGFFSEVDGMIPPTSGGAAFRLLSLVVLVAVLTLAALCLRTSRALTHEKLAWILATGLILFLSEFLWIGATGYMRASTEAYMLGVVVLLAGDLRWSRLAVLPVGVLWLATAFVQVVKAV